MAGRTIKTLGVAILTFAVSYVTFNLLCLLAYALASRHGDAEPAPALITGIPIGIACSLIAMVFYLFWSKRA
jgi:hypothetical protein